MLLRVAEIFIWYMKLFLLYEDKLLKDELVNGIKEDLIKLDGSNWTALLDGEWMVEFYSPWCPVCSAFDSNWKAFARSASSLGISVAQIDVTSSPDLSGRFVITILPTIFHVVDGEFREYERHRTAKAFEAFIRENKWKELEPFSSWKSPDSLLMTAISRFFKLLQIVRETLEVAYEWGYDICFGVGLLAIPISVYLAVMFIYDSCFTPRVQPPQILPSKYDGRNGLESMQNTSSNHYCGEIDHSAFSSDDFGSLCVNDNYSDVTLKVDGERIPAHKVILAARSEYFRALLFGGMRESSETDIELKGTNAELFKLLLKYIYSGHMSLGNIKEELILEILGLAHQYGFVELEAAISDFLGESLTVQNCCIVYDCARMYNLKFLMDVAASFIDKYAYEVIKQDTFLMLSAESVIELVSKDSFYAAEVDISKALLKWIQANPNISKENNIRCNVCCTSATDGRQRSTNRCQTSSCFTM